MYLSHCLRSIIRSSPITSSSSSSKPQDVVGKEVVQHEEIIQPKYVFDFEIIQVNEEDMIDMA